MRQELMKTKINDYFCIVIKNSKYHNKKGKKLGLDINFWRLKKADYDQYQQDVENWEENIKPEPISDAEFLALSKEEREAYDNAMYNDRPDFSKYSTPAGYFRKVNFLVSFFDYGDNCSLQEIDTDDIERLKFRCDKILEAYQESEEWRNREDASDFDYEDEPWEDVAEAYLPTQAGFFFGSTEYDEYYIDDIREVKEWCENLLSDLEGDDVVIMSCWW